MQLKHSLTLTLLAVAINSCDAPVTTPQINDADQTQTESLSNTLTLTDTSTPTDTDTFTPTDTDTITPTQTSTNTNTSVSNTLTIQENESGLCLVDGSIDNNNENFTGNGFANTENALGQSIVWEVNATESAEATLEFRFANGGATARSGNLDINGTSYSVNLESTGDWMTWSTTQLSVNLNKGLNTLKLTSISEDGLANIDYLEVEGVGVSSSDCMIEVVPEVTQTATTTEIETETETTTESTTMTDTDSDTDTQTSQPTDTETMTGSETQTQTETVTVTETQTDTGIDPIVISGELDRTAWVLDASHSTDDLLLAIDNVASTRWATRELQDDTQWLSIDLGDYYTINTIKLSHTESSEDYPRGYIVQTSVDGINWDTTIATGVGSSGVTTISFEDTDTQYIKIDQTGSDENSWWSIHELNVINQIDTKPDWTVQTLGELRDAISQSDQTIIMRSGYYSITDLPEGSRNLLFSGSNNTIDLVDVYVDVPVGSTARENYLVMEGSNNTLLGGTFEDTYTRENQEITDFVGYNVDGSLSYGLRGDPVMAIRGDANLIDGIHLTVRGSFPYGYGSTFGIGAGNSFGLSKRCGIVVTGVGTTIDNVVLQQRSFCHGIFMQSPADNTTIRNTLVEGAVRETNDMLAETSTDSLPYRNGYLDNDGNPIPVDEMHSLSEDGIRVYSGGGSVVVENTIVKKMRGGFRLWLATEVTITDSSAVDCGLSNYNLPRNATVINSSGNFSNGPLHDFAGANRSGQNLEITLLPSPDAVGAHDIINILHDSHTIVFHRADGPIDSDETRVIRVSSNNSTITNETEYKIILEEGTSGNTIISAGEVTDNGDNDVTLVELEL